jgi:hypothetical protein
MNNLCRCHLQKDPLRRWVHDHTPRRDLPRHQLGHVGADQGPPVPTLEVEFLEAQTQHQFVEDPGGGHRIEAWL